MKKAIKKIIEVVLTTIVCVSFVLMLAETPEGGVCLPWNLGWMAALAVSAKLLDKMGVFKKEGEDVEV